MSSIDGILTEFGINFLKKTDYFTVLCPFHEDTSPSGNINAKTRFFQCFACKHRATFLAYLAKQSGLALAPIKVRLGVRSDCKKPIQHTDVERFHINLWKETELLEQLYHRCIDNDIIRQYKLGMMEINGEKRVVIPIDNDVGEYASLRLYLPGAPTRKFLNFPAGGGKIQYKVRFYPIEQLEYDEILICGGELKALAAAKVLNPKGIGAVAPTCGENSIWAGDLNPRLQDKIVDINCDVDEIGQAAAEVRCKATHAFAREVHKIVLPLDIEKYPKGDINDFLREGGDLYQLIADTPPWIYVPGGTVIDEPPVDVSFAQAYNQDSVGKRVQFTGLITGVEQKQFLVPSLVEVQCPRDQEFCSVCDINTQACTNGSVEMAISPEHEAILGLIDDKKIMQAGVYKECFNIPFRCKVCKFVPKQRHSVHELHIEEMLEATSRNEALSMKTCYVVGDVVSYESDAYVFTGRLYPSPKNQVASFVASIAQPTADSLDAYTLENKEDLDIFQPTEWTLESLTEKLDDIYSDFEANITHIYRRRDLHIAVDLAYHSVLYFDLLGNRVIKGCTELLIVGDTSQGKSHCVRELRAHYGLGTKIDCANTSSAGLAIGLERGSARHFPVYGVLPKNDKGLVIFEELGKMPQDDFQKLTEARSSGQVQITKIQQKFRKARIRLIGISNPPPGRKISSYTYGIESALAIIGTHEDLRRFDLVIILGDADTPGGIPERANPPVYQHKYIDSLCQRLILRAWKCESVVFEDVQQIEEVSERLIAMFGSGLPIFDMNSSYLKVARLAIALAARTNSYEDILNGTVYSVLKVRRCHVEFIEQYLTRVYSAPSCRLLEKSKSVLNSTKIKGADILLRYFQEARISKDIINKLLDYDVITSTLIKDLVGDIVKGGSLFAKLIQSNSLTRISGDKYAKNPAFTELMKNTDISLLKPDFLKEEEF